MTEPDDRYIIQLDGKDIGSHCSQAHAELWAECVGGTVVDLDNPIDFEEMWNA